MRVIFFACLLLYLKAYAFDTTQVGQFFIVPACPQRGEEHIRDLEYLIDTYNIGGIILKQANPHEQIALIRRLQKRSKTPLLCVLDAENGLGMRMDDTISFPKNLTLGAIQDETLIYALGKEIGRQCKLVGCHVNLAPVVDVNNNPKNPIIHMRSFGEDPKLVARKASHFIQGMESEGVLACLKHFPGHGDVIQDSHIELPLLSHQIEHLYQVELKPFQALLHQVSSIMIGHLKVPALAKYPSSLSKKIITYLLKKQMGFKGIVFTDALNMKALTKNYTHEEIATLSFLAGSNFLLYGDHIAPNVDEILRVIVPCAIESVAELKGSLLEKRYKAIRQFKKAVIPKGELEVDIDLLHTNEAYKLKKRLYEEALTLVRDPMQLLLKINHENYSSITWGEPIPKTLEEIVVCSFKNMNTSFYKQFGIPTEAIEFLKKLQKLGHKICVVLYGTPYATVFFDKDMSVIVAYEEVPEMIQAVKSCFEEALVPKGVLPISLSK